MNDPDSGQPVSRTTTDPGPTRVVWWRRDRAAVLALVVATVGTWWIRRHGPAWAMEEAMMLQAPTRVAHGAVPGRDFDWFYGPLSLLIPAGVYRVASPSLVVERAIGAAYVFVVGVALHFVGRHRSFAIGLAMGCVGVLIGGLSMTALPIMGAIGALTGALAFALSGLDEHPRAWVTGLAAAVAVGLRPDFLIWVVVVFAVLSLTRTIRPLTWVAMAVGLVPFAWPVLLAGFGTTWRNLVTDAAQVASERHLPWHADLSGTGILAIVGVIVSVAAVVVGVRCRRETSGVALLGLGVIGLCLVPEYLQRADAVHVVYVTMIPLATVVPLAHELLGGSRSFAGRSTWRVAAAIVVVGVVLIGIRPKFVARAGLRDLRSTLTDTNTHPVTIDGNTWYYRDAEVQRARARLARTAADVAPPGATLFVGPSALDRPSYTDGSFYTLLPGYAQHTHFYDFHPRIAHTEADRLADDVAAADVLILCDTGFTEGNLSNRPGSRAANVVVADRFELVETAGNCHLYLRIDGERGGSS